MQLNKSLEASPSKCVVQPMGYQRSSPVSARLAQTNVLDQMNKVCLCLMPTLYEDDDMAFPWSWQQLVLLQYCLCVQMELWAKSVERRSLDLTRTNRQLRMAVEKGKRVGFAHYE